MKWHANISENRALWLADKQLTRIRTSQVLGLMPSNIAKDELLLWAGSFWGGSREAVLNSFQDEGLFWKSSCSIKVWLVIFLWIRVIIPLFWSNCNLFNLLSCMIWLLKKLKLHEPVLWYFLKNTLMPNAKWNSKLCGFFLWRIIPGGVLGISSDGDNRRIFLGLKFSILGFFWVQKFGKYFFG